MILFNMTLENTLCNHNMEEMFTLTESKCITYSRVVSRAIRICETYAARAEWLARLIAGFYLEKQL